MRCNFPIRLLLVMLILAVVSGCEPQAPTQEVSDSDTEFLTYENQEYGVKIDYPADWQQTEPDDSIVAFITPKINSVDTGNNINLMMNDLSGQGLTPGKYNDLVVSQLEQTFQDIDITESGPMTLAGLPGYKIVYQSSNLKFLQAWVVKNDISYIWTYVSYPGSFESDLPTIEKMLSTFEITNDPRQAQEEQPVEELATGTADPLLVGNWRAYSERLFYDAGGGGATTTTGRRLLLNEDGSWEFGSSTGTWSTSDITSEDWTRWGIDSYGPSRKIVLENWNNDASADGPIEGSDVVDFVWVIYHVEPPLVTDPGTVWIKFGH